MSDKTKFELEFTVNCSPNVLYERLSTPDGLSEWFADDVRINKGIFTFFWEGSGQEAKIVKETKGKLIQFHWMDEPDDTYFEFRIQIDPITKDLALIVTDFADEDEVEEQKRLWESQVGGLKHLLGS
jgi:uncharacterized protein YndB with AHSA1/START domain